MRGYKSTRKRAKLAIEHCAVCRYVRQSAVCGTCRWRAALAAEEVDGQEMFAFQAEAEEAERLGHVEILEVRVIEIGDPTAPVCEFCGWSTGAEWSDRNDRRLVRARQPDGRVYPYCSAVCAKLDERHKQLRPAEQVTFEFDMAG
jgi:hypothetical protein